MAANECRITLSADVWYMVFEELGIADFQGKNEEVFAAGMYKRWIRETRLVCKDFYTIVTPWNKANLINYAAWLQVSTSPNPESLALTACIVEGCKKLEYLHWDNSREDQVNDVELAVSTIVCSYLNGASSTQRWSFDATTEGGQIEHILGSWSNKTSRVLARREGSLGKDAQLSVYRTSYENEYDTFADPKPKSTALQTLKFPPMKKLKLCTYDWLTSAEEFPLMWDFSSLYCLSMTLEFAGFMSRVPIDSLSQLRTFFLCAQFFNHSEDDYTTPVAAQKFTTSLIDSCKHLENLKIESNYWQDLLPMSSVVKAGTRLRKLRLIGLGELVPIPKTFLVDGLDHCSNLVDLGLDLDVADPNMYEYLGILARKESLRDINLYTKDTLRVENFDEHSTDSDYDGATTIMQFLHTQKSGRRFNMVRIRLVDAKEPPNWRPGLEEIEFYEGVWCHRRDFMSRINIIGTFEQWGSKRIGELPEGHTEVGDKDKSEYREINAEDRGEGTEDEESRP
ncbi:hypothetical protein VTL71DRAFT_13727 [Oculimacula yallundae]|uniref:Uncharacterized protein n=1 Tax=Oculimacula yallundae TaxID=86028 RepID=A0ABR4CMU3_9HELO